MTAENAGRVSSYAVFFHMETARNTEQQFSRMFFCQPFADFFLQVERRRKFRSDPEMYFVFRALVLLGFQALSTRFYIAQAFGVEGFVIFAQEESDFVDEVAQAAAYWFFSPIRVAWIFWQYFN